MTTQETAEKMLQFDNGYAEIRGVDLFIAVEGRCLAMPLAKWMDRGWGIERPAEPLNQMQESVIQALHRQNEGLQKQCDELREIALLTARKLRS